MSDARREARGARFDEAIDGAVREMLDVEPRADMRARVVERIGARAASFQFPVASVHRFAVLAGAAAVLVLALVLALARHSEPPAQPPVVAQGADMRLPVDTAGHPAIRTPIASQRVLIAAKTGVTRLPARAATAASIDTANAVPEIDPLKTISPIEVAPMAPSDITPDPIGVRPLSPIPEVQIAPLNPPERRD